MQRIFLVTVLFVFGLVAQAQKPQHVDSAGNLYWNKNAPIFLFVSDSPDGKDLKRLNSERSKEYTNPLFLDTEGKNFVRTRNAVDPETMQPIPNSEIMFEIYADGTAPRSSAAFEYVQKHQVDGVDYYRKEVTVALTTSDNLAGAEDIMYSINGEAPVPYTDSINFDETGRYIFKFSSRDKVGNKEDIREIRFAIDGEIPYSDLNINGIANENVIGPGSKVYIQAIDTISGLEMVYFRFDSSDYKQYLGGLVEFNQLTEGNHTISYYSVDKVGNQEEPKTYSFFFDKSAPILVSDVLGDRFIVGDEIYFSGRTKLKLTSVDNKVGVKEIMYSIDDEPYQPYTKPFYLPSVSGVHNIKFYSVDNLGNSTADSRKSRYLGSGVEEYKHNVSKIYVDLAGPEINYTVDKYSFRRNDTLYIGPSTTIEFSGNDAESGFKEIHYSLNNELGETPYDGPFTLPASGFNVLNIYGYDNVNNRNVDRMPFYQDIVSPEIYVTFTMNNLKTKEGLPVYAHNTGIYLAAMDVISGVSELKYELDGEAVRNYAGEIKNLTYGKHTLKIFARDNLNNPGEKEVSFFIE